MVSMFWAWGFKMAPQVKIFLNLRDLKAFQEVQHILESLLILPLKTIKTRRQKYLSRHLALVCIGTPWMYTLMSYNKETRRMYL